MNVAVDELRDLIYSGNPGGLSIISGKNNEVLEDSPASRPFSCGGLAVNTFTNLVYCTDDNTDSLTVISGPLRSKRRHCR